MSVLNQMCVCGGGGGWGGCGWVCARVCTCEHVRACVCILYSPATCPSCHSCFYSVQLVITIDYH